MVLNNGALKQYQINLLDAFGAWLARTRELNDPAAAFAESTKAHFGAALPYHPLPGAKHTPYACLRVPTGGGKTRIAGHAIERVNKAFLATEHALVLWLVPSEPIREQTLNALKTPGELLHQDMRDLFGSVHVLGIDEALYLQPATLNTANTIIVATMQSFKRDTADGLRVYKQNGALMAHFTGLPPDVRGEGSLVDVIRLRRPFVIVDEAHNQGTLLAVDTLLRFNPACVLELTATPDRANQPSNVLRSVSAATLQAEDMLKLPLELAVHPEWKVSFTEALARLRQLEKDAAQEKKATGETIDPIVMLIQAERKIQGKETFTPEAVKQRLIEDFNIPPERIAIATGALDELAGRRLGDPDFPQFIITVDKLREGWDCPFAYILFSFRNTTSATAVEQVLGRVLRMPHAVRKTREPLNRSYAYVVSDELVAAVQGLRDGLVQNGFERLDAKSFILTEAEEYAGDLFTPSGDVTVPLPVIDDVLTVPDESAIAALPKSLRERIEVSPESGAMTIKGALTATQVKQVAETFKKPELVKVMRERLDTVMAVQLAPPQPEKTPAERGDKGVVPLLSFRQGSFFDIFDETMLLEGDWEITDFDSVLTESDFPKDIEAMRRASLSMSQLEKIECEFYDRLDAQLALLDMEAGWSVLDLTAWLDRNIYFPFSERDRKVAWIGAAINHLIDARGFSIEEISYRKFRLRGALERKMAQGLVEAKQQIFDDFFSDESNFETRDEHHVVFEQGRYSYDYPYTGAMRLKRHFYPTIGNLRSTGEEFECAQFIANELEGVEWWVRNIERKNTSFWLQTASDRFYPDFVIRMKDGRALVVEYKGSHIAESRDSKEKWLIGEMWARRSGGRCRFAWVTNRNFSVIADALK